MVALLLAMLASFVTAPICGVESGVDYPYHAYVMGEISWSNNSIVRTEVRLFKKISGVWVFQQSQDWDVSGWEYNFDIGYLDGNVEEYDYKLVFIPILTGGTIPLNPPSVEFKFPDDFQFVPKYWKYVHDHHFGI